jgi:hypothetical protein
MPPPAVVQAVRTAGAASTKNRRDSLSPSPPAIMDPDAFSDSLCMSALPCSDSRLSMMAPVVTASRKSRNHEAAIHAFRSVDQCRDVAKFPQFRAR